MIGWDEYANDLKAPFPLDVHYWKPGATTREKDRALALVYAEPRAYIERLNNVIGDHWTDDYEYHIAQDRILVVCRLTVFGKTRADVGEEPLYSLHGKNAYSENAFTTAVAQAFKRACVKFGLGAYLYSAPSEWASYDGQRRKFTKEGLDYLKGALAHYLGQSAEKPSQPRREEPPAQQARERAKQPAAQQQSGKMSRPMTPDQIKKALQIKGDKGSGNTSSKAQAELIARLYQEVWAGDNDAEDKYHKCLIWLSDVESAHGLTSGQASSHINYLRLDPQSKEDYSLHPLSIKELQMVLVRAEKDPEIAEFFESDSVEEHQAQFENEVAV